MRLRPRTTDVFSTGDRRNVMTSNSEARKWQVTCVCGWRVRGTKEEVVAAVQAHGRTVHGQMLTEDQVMQRATTGGS